MELSTTSPCAKDLTPEEYEEYTAASKGGFNSSDPVRKRFYLLMAAGKERNRQEAIEAAAEEIEEKILDEIEDQVEPLRKDLHTLLHAPRIPSCFSLSFFAASFVLLLTAMYFLEIHHSHHLGISTELVPFNDRCTA